MTGKAQTVHVDVKERKGGARIATVTVDNEGKLNCLGLAQIRRIEAAFHKLEGDEALRAVVLTGAGTRAFIGGADLNELGTVDREGARTFITALHHAHRAIRSFPVPVIGRINGFALGAGMETAASCDMRVAAKNAVFGMPEVRMGIPSVIEAALLPGLIGWGRTRELLLTGDTISADEALAMGLVERVVAQGEMDEVIDHWLEGICASTPLAVRAQKALINRWERSSVEEGVLAGIDALADSYLTGEPQAAIEAFFAAKRAKAR
jgi:enoyl-CoA hydratase/carnithine racemase